VATKPERTKQEAEAAVASFAAAHDIDVIAYWGDVRRGTDDRIIELCRTRRLRRNYDAARVRYTRWTEMRVVISRSFLALMLTSVAVLCGSSARAQDEAATVNDLLRGVKNHDWEIASGAIVALFEHPRFKAQIVPILIDALKTREWNRCGGDMRDNIARLLIEFKAREAVPALLELAASGRRIDHECVE
jgi:hypothetical protein